MWIDRLTASRTTHALTLAAQFAEQRHKVLAENLANLDTPDYATKRLDPEAFQSSLRQALEQARTTRHPALVLRGNAQFSSDAQGRIQARPARTPAPNVLFHDGTNARLEPLLTDVAQNNVSYDVAMNLLRGRLENLLRAKSREEGQFSIVSETRPR
jgi:flagellar basal-body rod protein FlgB